MGITPINTHQYTSIAPIAPINMPAGDRDALWVGWSRVAARRRNWQKFLSRDKRRAL